MTYGTATLPEIVWSLIAAVGLVVSILAVGYALQTLHYLQAVGVNGAREKWARNNVRSESIRLAIHSISMIIGIAAMSSLPINPDVPIPPLSAILSFGLILISLLIVVSSITEKRTRDDIVAAMVAEERRLAAIIPSAIEAAASQIIATAHQVEMDAEAIRATAVEMQTVTEEPK
ncbi:MAG: hypothetical protein M3440_04685 [Chloroflexota bacterium]|nr:hypothetical protein [Chloroflexota bacterium]